MGTPIVLVQTAITTIPVAQPTDLYFSQFWSWKFKIKVPTDPVTGESSLSSLRRAIFLLSLHMKESRERKQTLSSLFLLELQFHHEVSTLMT